MLHAILHKNKLIGLYSNYEKCFQTVNGLVNHKFVLRSDIVIKSYLVNSITEGEYQQSENEIMEEFSSANTTETDTTDKVILNEEKMKEKIDLQNSIGELKRKKEKLEESKRVFDVDLDLYKKFKTIKLTNSEFSIPDMFIDKFVLMYQLENEDKLNWFNFNELYKQKTLQTSFSKLFEQEHEKNVPY